MIDLTTARWTRSSRVPAGRCCVEIAVDRDGAAVRDGKNPTGPVLRFSRAAFGAFLADVKAEATSR